MLDDIISQKNVRDALEILRPGRDDNEDAVARVAWSMIADANDAQVGALIAERGAAEALRAVLQPGVRTPGARDSRELIEKIPRWRSNAVTAEVAAAIVKSSHLIGVRLILPGDAGWSTGMDALGNHRPLLLWTLGAAELLNAPRRIAVIGARAATLDGERRAHHFVTDLAASGVVVNHSGQYGIDAAVARAALAVDAPSVAFLAGGLDRLTPYGHEALFSRLAETGLIVTEQSPGSTATRWKLLARNRLLAANSHAIVIVEAGMRSSNLNVVGHAALLDIPVAAVEGPDDAPASAGCNFLVREQGAISVASRADVRALLEPTP
ncbi:MULTISPECIES: DNA-processing protein DprA [unclassified Microbacterium]|uniref:DNA-processing protein DprA n=1 Tax=unclassified Microbacterium TaxID=2609290 RepID=UPI002882FE04|nr:MULTISPECIES: DNA-processing protein DprA [unclassified Microbacterium]